jgi:hypothetical protein
MNLSDISIVCGLCTSFLAAGGTAGNYYLKNEFVSSESLQQYELRGLKRDSRKLKRMLDDGNVTVEDDYLDLLDEIQDIQDEMNE